MSWNRIRTSSDEQRPTRNITRKQCVCVCVTVASVFFRCHVREIAMCFWGKCLVSSFHIHIQITHIIINVSQAVIYNWQVSSKGEHWVIFDKTHEKCAGSCDVDAIFFPCWLCQTVFLSLRLFFVRFTLFSKIHCWINVWWLWIWPCQMRNDVFPSGRHCFAIIRCTLCPYKNMGFNVLMYSHFRHCTVIKWIWMTTNVEKIQNKHCHFVS